MTCTGEFFFFFVPFCCFLAVADSIPPLCFVLAPQILMNAKEPITVRLADHLLVPTPLVLILVPVTLGILGLERPAQAKTPIIFFLPVISNG